jgi:hypothetical protein
MHMCKDPKSRDGISVEFWLRACSCANNQNSVTEFLNRRLRLCRPSFSNFRHHSYSQYHWTSKNLSSVDRLRPLITSVMSQSDPAADRLKELSRNHNHLQKFIGDLEKLKDDGSNIATWKLRTERTIFRVLLDQRRILQSLANERAYFASISRIKQWFVNWYLL